jgi:hypothetical protein
MFTCILICYAFFQEKTGELIIGAFQAKFPKELKPADWQRALDPTKPQLFYTMKACFSSSGCFDTPN